MNPSLRERLNAVARRRGVAAGAPAGSADSSSADSSSTQSESADSGRAEPVGSTTPSPVRGRARKIPPLEKVLPGVSRACEGPSPGHGSCWVHTRLATGWPGVDPSLGARLRRCLSGAPPADLTRDPALDRWRELTLSGALFLDLETTGLAGVPIFLAGLLSAEADGRFEFRLYLARDYREEAALLAAVAWELRRRPVVVTYNGKSYDIPTLRERSSRLRVPFPDAIPIFDLLHPARRRWGGRFADCRLSTLERHLCGRPRMGDIAGAEIPAAYHKFVRDGDPRSLLRVFQHNLMDLHTLADVTALVLESSPRATPSSDRGHP